MPYPVGAPTGTPLVPIERKAENTAPGVPSALAKDVVSIRFRDGRELVGRVVSLQEGPLAATVTVEVLKPEALAKTDELEKEMLALVNRERTQRGLPPLALSPALSEVARRYARQMIEGDFFAHQDPQGNGMVERVKGAGLGYRRLAENLSFAPDLAASHQGLMESPGHRQNILNPQVTEAGIGIQVVTPSDPFTGAGQAKRPLTGYLVVTQLFRLP